MNKPSRSLLAINNFITAAARGARAVRYSAALALAGVLALSHTASAQPVVGTVDVAGIMLCTNTELTCIITSASSTITNVSLSYTTTLLGGGSANSVTTNGNSHTAGLGTATATFTFPLVSNVIYTALTISALDATGASGTTNALITGAPEVLDTLQPALVIESEDYNYTNGAYLNTSSDGGFQLYQNLVGVPEVDFHWQKSTGPASNYRQGDASSGGVLGAGPQSEYDNNTFNGLVNAIMPQKFFTALAGGDSTDIPIEIGYNSTGNWFDYTRDLGPGGSNSAPSGTYNIWAFCSDDDSGGVFNMSLVTSDPTTSNQTTSATLGQFNLTDANWNSYYYVPMVDQFGNLASVNLSGHTTLRATVIGEANLDFYMLIPAVPVLSPILQNISPNHPFGLTNLLSFTVGAADGAGIPEAGIHLVVNGQNVTSGVNLSGSTNSWTGTFAISSNTIYTATLTVSNAAGLISTFPISFDTFDPNNFIWEAVDYDFSTNTGTSLPAIQGLETNAGWVSGLFIDNPEPTADVTANLAGHLATNSFFNYPMDILPDLADATNGAVAQQGVDVLFATTSGEQIAYRNDSMGSQPATDYLRPKFAAAQKKFTDPNIGEFNIGWTSTGDWENYTRTFPVGKFEIYGRIAGNSAWANSGMALVTNGFGTANQQYTVLGSFSDPNANGWQSYHWIPLVDSSGVPVSVELGGKQTLKFTCGGGVNEEFYMLVPFEPPTVPVLVSAFPDGSQPFQSTNVFSFEVTSASGAPIDASGIGLTLNGVSVNGELTLNSSSTNWTVNAPLQSNTLYDAVISVTNTSGIVENFYKTFDTFSVDNYTFEANDYDFTITNGSVATSAQFIDNALPSCDTSGPGLGELETNSYFNYPGGLSGMSGALANVDFFDQSPQPIGAGNDYYRADGQGSAPSGDFLRPKFLTARTQFGDVDIGPFQEGFTSKGDWGNYTRHYPPGTFNIYGRMAGNSAWSGTEVAMVNSGVGTATQTYTVLGSFADPNANGWESFHWVPLLDTNTGAMSAVTLGGKATLKVICGGGVNEGYYMLVPAAATVPRPTLTAAIVTGSLNISIPTVTGHTYTLLFTAALSPASWAPVGTAITGDGSSHVVVEATSGNGGFYKVQVQ